MAFAWLNVSARLSLPHKMLSRCCILAFAAFFQKATEGNTTKYVVRKIQRTENSGKGRENGGKGRTLKIEVQILPETCPNVFFHGF